MAFALNVSVSYLAYVAYKNLRVSTLKHAIHKNIMPKFSSYVTVNLLHYKDNIVNSVRRTIHCLIWGKEERKKVRKKNRVGKMDSLNVTAGVSGSS